MVILRAPTVAMVVTDLLSLVPVDFRLDLIAEDPLTALEVHFAPLRVRALPVARMGDDCSVDGYYESYVDPARPCILYSADASPARVRFTLLHELGHHLIATSAAHLL